MVPRSIPWLWPQRLALGKLAMLDGDPGMGKSLLSLDLCARLTTGRAFPDNALAPGPANVLILNAEDSPDDILVPPGWAPWGIALSVRGW
jgi:RecA-family ATPase